MNNASQCIFDICHVLKTLRDTMEFVLPKEHEVKSYDQRKTILTSITDNKSFLGKFIEDNAEKLTQFKEKYQEFLKEIYGEDSTVLVKTADDKIRVDHTQHQKIYDYVIYLSETLRDILYSHVNFARSKGQVEEITAKLVNLDERFDRLLKSYLVMQEYQKSFSEFQKVMGESKGQATPQSNYIVQNELSKMATMIRFVRAHAHCTDNETLDIMDDNIELIEMTEGRRERRDGKPFADFFKASMENFSNAINKIAPEYQASYDAALKEMLETIKKNNENKKEEVPEA